MKSKSKTIKVDALARVEGEGGLYIKVKENQVVEVKLNIFEPPRFFEAFLHGRSYKEVPDIVARICGICPIAYQMSAVHALENAFGVTVDGQLRELRRLFYCGEWIESHVLHVYMLHAPDFLGYEDAFLMAKDYPAIVERGLKMKKIGNALVSLMGGRSVHPVSACVGGFYKVPTKQELNTLVDDLNWAQDAALETVRWTAQFEFPDFEPDYEFVALRHPDEYPFNEGRIVSNKGLDIAINQYNEYFMELHVPHSTSLHSKIKQRDAYSTGPLARFNLNFDKLTPLLQQAAKEAGLKVPCMNPFKSIIARSIETLYACEEALRIIENYQMPDQAYIPVTPRAGVGHGCTEAPRGILYHRYRVGDDGLIVEAKIVPPTSQNQKIIEQDLWKFLPQIIESPVSEITWKCEQAVRNYDPCISCSCHFLKLTIDKE
ncbi:MAG: Ni/Fe hydrogenase subunit alpha [bacterium]|nr:Ni/Fe hydrogenase subunit alpha [bacterium]